MEIKRSGSGKFWHVVFGDIFIDCFYTKREAEQFVNECGELPHLLRKQAM